ncbi:hypothetical protein Y695_03703 [Hydrogenophaga sp. T4]|nr:hypothetical protein Y695_03703 [Hydrogenophaga sp. T4]
MCNRRTKRTGAGPLHIHVDPLVVPGGFGKPVDLLLGDGDPVAHSHFLAHTRGQIGQGFKGFHGRDSSRPTLLRVSAARQAATVDICFQWRRSATPMHEGVQPRAPPGRLCRTASAAPLGVARSAAGVFRFSRPDLRTRSAHLRCRPARPGRLPLLPAPRRSGWPGRWGSWACSPVWSTAR